MTNNDLPCARGQCPHGAMCCKDGVDLEPEEAILLMSTFGPDCVTQDRKRTAVENGTCVFRYRTGCMLHDGRRYPKVCQAFPLDGYQGDPGLCPAAVTK